MTVGSAVVGLVVAVLAAASAGPWDAGQRRAERAAAAEAAAARAGSGGGSGDGSGGTEQGGVDTTSGVAGSPRATAPLAALGLDSAPLPNRQALSDALDPLLAKESLGDTRAAAVIDASTGRALYLKDADTPTVPASTIKIATAVAAIEVLGADHSIPTTVVAGAAPDQIVLVGGGDPTLTAGGGTGQDRPASLRQLARETAEAVKDRGRRKVRLYYDTSRYSGPVRHPIGVNDNLAAVVPLMLDEGRVDPKSTENAPRHADPAAEAAATFASLLARDGVTVAGRPRPGKARDAQEGKLAEVRSPALSDLVERMLTNSDNDIAEALARQVALATGRPASFAGGAQAVTRALTAAGLPMKGARIHDGSGLSGTDRVTAALLSKLLGLAAAPDHPELRPVLTGLPIAGFTGTLQDRYTDANEPAAGLVRAKTGTLSGVNALAGMVVDADGRLLAFAFLVKGTGDPAAAESGLDHLAATLANCGCR